MALTRKLLKGMGLTDEQIDSVIDAHTETVDALKDQVNTIKADADRLKEVEKELNSLKNGKDWKAEYDKEKKAFEDYKTEIAGKETSRKIRAEYRKLLEKHKIANEDIDLIMAATDFGEMKLNDDGALDKVDDYEKSIAEKYARYIPKESVQGIHVSTPPANGGTKKTKAEIMAIKDDKERRQEIAANHELFGF